MHWLDPNNPNSPFWNLLGALLLFFGITASLTLLAPPAEFKAQMLWLFWLGLAVVFTLILYGGVSWKLVKYRREPRA